MCMLEWMCSKTHKDKVRNERIRRFLGVEYIEDTVSERQLTWYGYVTRRLPMVPIMRCLNMHVSVGCRLRGSPLNT